MRIDLPASVPSSVNTIMPAESVLVPREMHVPEHTIMELGELLESLLDLETYSELFTPMSILPDFDLIAPEALKFAIPPMDEINSVMFDSTEIELAKFTITPGDEINSVIFDSTETELAKFAVTPGDEINSVIFDSTEIELAKSLAIEIESMMAPLPAMFEQNMNLMTASIEPAIALPTSTECEVQSVDPVQNHVDPLVLIAKKKIDRISSREDHLRKYTILKNILRENAGGNIDLLPRDYDWCPAFNR